jgi:hypothetical protein
MADQRTPPVSRQPSGLGPTRCYSERMDRRQVFQAGALAVAGATTAQGASQRSVFELRYVRMRNGPQVQRTAEHFEKAVMPAQRRAGAGPMGFFSALIAPDAPFLLSVVSYPSLASMEAALRKIDADKEFAKAADDYDSMSELRYVRMETSLLRGFETMPAVEVPRIEGGRAPRIFELRMYEANNLKASRRKIRMFDEGEIGIFRRLGMTPVFFGETIAGQNMPNLVYMLGFDDLAHREKAWRTFGTDPEWQKMRALPGLSDAEIVSNISSSILRPLPFSPIR